MRDIWLGIKTLASTKCRYYDFEFHFRLTFIDDYDLLNFFFIIYFLFV